VVNGADEIKDNTIGSVFCQYINFTSIISPATTVNKTVTNKVEILVGKNDLSVVDNNVIGLVDMYCRNNSISHYTALGTKKVILTYTTTNQYTPSVANENTVAPSNTVNNYNYLNVIKTGDITNNTIFTVKNNNDNNTAITCDYAGTTAIANYHYTTVINSNNLINNNIIGSINGDIITSATNNVKTKTFVKGNNINGGGSFTVATFSHINNVSGCTATNIINIIALASATTITNNSIGIISSTSNNFNTTNQTNTKTIKFVAAGANSTVSNNLFGILNNHETVGQTANTTINIIDQGGVFSNNSVGPVKNYIDCGNAIVNIIEAKSNMVTNNIFGTIKSDTMSKTSTANTITISALNASPTAENVSVGAITNTINGTSGSATITAFNGATTAENVSVGAITNLVSGGITGKIEILKNVLSTIELNVGNIINKTMTGVNNIDLIFGFNNLTNCTIGSLETETTSGTSTIKLLTGKDANANIANVIIGAVINKNYSGTGNITAVATGNKVETLSINSIKSTVWNGGTINVISSFKTIKGCVIGPVDQISTVATHTNATGAVSKTITNDIKVLIATTEISNNTVGAITNIIYHAYNIMGSTTVTRINNATITAITGSNTCLIDNNIVGVINNCSIANNTSSNNEMAGNIVSTYTTTNQYASSVGNLVNPVTGINSITNNCTVVGIQTALIASNNTLQDIKSITDNTAIVLSDNATGNNIVTKNNITTTAISNAITTSGNVVGIITNSGLIDNLLNLNTPVSIMANINGGGSFTVATWNINTPVTYLQVAGINTISNATGITGATTVQDNYLNNIYAYGDSCTVIGINGGVTISGNFLKNLHSFGFVGLTNTTGIIGSAAANITNNSIDLVNAECSSVSYGIAQGITIPARNCVISHNKVFVKGTFEATGLKCLATTGTSTAENTTNTITAIQPHWGINPTTGIGCDGMVNLKHTKMHVDWTCSKQTYLNCFSGPTSGTVNSTLAGGYNELPEDYLILT
jgi:hypothetical protein